jgi:transposase
MLAIAVEISSKKWLVCSSAGGKPVRRKTLDQDSAQARVDGLILEVAMATRKAGGGPGTRVVVAYEAGQEGFWLVRALRTAGLDAEVIDASSLQVDRRHKRAKTDRLDAEALARALYAWMNDGKALRMVRVPSKAEEDDREWQRERDRLVKAQRGGLDRIGKKLRTHGIWDWDRQSLREGRLLKQDGDPVCPMLRSAMLLELDQVEASEAALQSLMCCIEDLSEAAQSRIDRLACLRGIGPVGAKMLALLLFFRTFDNRRQVGACVGLVGAPYDSGERHQDQGISKQGDARLRGGLIELAWCWLRWQPTSAISQWFAERTQGQGKRHRRIMIVAVARRLTIALWRYLRDGVIPQGAVLKAR